MTKDKKFKRLVRTTAAESGQRYQQVRQRLRPENAARDPVARLLDVAAGRPDVALAARARLRDMEAGRHDPGLVAAYSLVGVVAARLTQR